jgi:hypothetical protein
LLNVKDALVVERPLFSAGWVAVVSLSATTGVYWTWVWAGTVVAWYIWGGATY